MCVNPISAICFKSGKIELNRIKKDDLSNYDSIKRLAAENFCDFLIEKKPEKNTCQMIIYIQF